MSATEIPDNWDELTDEQKREAARAMLKTAAAATGLLDEPNPKRTFKSPAR